MTVADFAFPSQNSILLARPSKDLLRHVLLHVGSAAQRSKARLCTRLTCMRPPLQLPTTDVAVISAGVKALGGQWSAELTREVTHLFVVAPRGVSEQVLNTRDTPRVS